MNTEQYGKSCSSHHLVNVILLNVEIGEENELVMIDEFFDVSQTDFRPVWLKDTRLSYFLPSLAARALVL